MTKYKKCGNVLLYSTHNIQHDFIKLEQKPCKIINDPAEFYLTKGLFFESRIKWFLDQHKVYDISRGKKQMRLIGHSSSDLPDFYKSSLIKRAPEAYRWKSDVWWWFNIAKYVLWFQYCNILMQVMFCDVDSKFIFFLSVILVNHSRKHIFSPLFYRGNSSGFAN